MKKMFLILIPILIILAGCKDNRTAEGLFNDIEKSIENDELSSAKKDVEKLIVKAPESTDAFMLKGIVETKLEEYNLAMLSFQKSIAFDTLNCQAYVERAKLKLILGDYNGSINDCNIARFINKEYFKIYVTKGIAYNMLGDAPNAIIQFKYAIKYGDNSGETHYKLGVLCIGQGKKEKGCSYLSEAGNLGYMKAYDLIKSTCNKTQNQTLLSELSTKSIEESSPPNSKKELEESGTKIRFITTQIGIVENDKFKLLRDIEEAGNFIFIKKQNSIVIRHDNGNDELLNVLDVKKTPDNNYLFICDKNRNLFVSYNEKLIMYSIEDNSSMFSFPITHKDIPLLKRVVSNFCNR